MCFKTHVHLRLKLFLLFFLFRLGKLIFFHLNLEGFVFFFILDSDFASMRTKQNRICVESTKNNRIFNSLEKKSVELVYEIKASHIKR